jgi:metallophosphoesterase (TIGR00282 family)
LREEYRLDAVIANAENAAGGLGVTPSILKDLFSIGIDGITLGNHTWRKKELVGSLDLFSNVVRPLNYPEGVPGRGSMILDLPDGRRIGVINALGRVYMEPYECPFRMVRREAARLREQAPVVVVDFHAEATSEKVAFGWHMDGYCTAVLGTHTHVQTSDDRLLKKGTAYITDAGMTGPRDSIIGLDTELGIQKFLTGLPNQFKVAAGPVQLNGVVVDADDANGRALSISRVFKAGELTS